MKKKGSALVMAIFVLAIVSMLILSSYKEVVSRNTEIQDNIQVNYDDNIRDNGMVILEHELKTIKKYQNQRGIFFKDGSNYVKDTPHKINLNQINYKKNPNGSGYEPKDNQHYTGMIINSFYDYIGKTLKKGTDLNGLNNLENYPWFATSLYIDNSNSEITDTSNGGLNTQIKWVYKKNGSDKFDNLVSLVSQIKLIRKSDDSKITSIGGYKIKEIKNLTKNKLFKKSDNFKNYRSPNDGNIVKITYEKKIVVGEIKNYQKNKKINNFNDLENFTIEMSIQGEFKNGDFKEDDLIKNTNITRTAKIIREDD